MTFKKVKKQKKVWTNTSFPLGIKIIYNYFRDFDNFNASILCHVPTNLFIKIKCINYKNLKIALLLNIFFHLYIE